MGFLKHSPLALLLSLQLGGSSLAFAGDDDIRINPLMTLPETLHQAQIDCAGRPYDYRCIDTIESIQNDIAKLKEICKKNSKDMRCDAIRRKDSDRKSGIAVYCSDHPDDKECIRRRATLKKAALQKAMICKSRPDSPRCRPSVAKPDSVAAFTELCQIYPDRRDCKRFHKEQDVKRRENLRQRAREAGDFSF